MLEAAAGLTRYEAEGAFALSQVRHEGRILPETIWELKAEMLRKTGVLELHQGQESFQDLGGLQSLKDFCKRALAKNRPVDAKGVLLLGVPGTGKSAFAKALGVEVGRPTLLFDVGAVYGSLVGESEQRLRQALKIADAMAPCILFIDEVEKSLSGVGGNGDGGVSSRLFGSLLTWLNDHDSNVFVVCTANDVSKLPPEFTRAERFDGCFFLDLPGFSEQDDIWRQYLRQFGLRREGEVPTVPDSKGWTGAEIKACCRLAALLGVPLTEAAQQIVPVSVTAADKVAALRSWADGRCLSASEAGVFRQAKASSSASQTRRRVQKQPPSAN